MQRLEAAVVRLEALSTRGGVDVGGDGADAESDPSIVAFNDLTGQYLSRISSAAEKIGGQVLDVTKLIEQAFATEKDLLVKIKQSQVDNFQLYFDSCGFDLSELSFLHYIWYIRCLDAVDLEIVDCDLIFEVSVNRL